MFRTFTIAAGFAALLAAPASALGVADTFNDGSTTGWTASAGSITESGGLFSGSTGSLALFDGGSGTSVGVDAVLSGSGTSYVAVVLSHAGLSDGLFVKLQRNGGSANFDYLGFYRNNNGGGATVETSFVALATPVGDTYFEVTLNGNGTITAYVGASGESVTRTLTGTWTGTGVGLGFYGNAHADNFYLGDSTAQVPLPAPVLLLGGAIAGLGALRLRRG